MIEKSSCRHCAQPIEFEADDWISGVEVTCPGCEQKTELFLTRVDPNHPKPKPRPLPSPLPRATARIEDSMETVALLYLAGSALASVVIGLNAIIFLADAKTDKAIVPGLIAVGILGQAWIVRTLIYGFAEVVRLLRKGK
jgi:hypothetical protein